MSQSQEEWHEVSVPTLTTGQLKEALEFEGTSGHLFELEDAVYPVGSAAVVDAADNRNTDQMLVTSLRKVKCSRTMRRVTRRCS